MVDSGVAEVMAIWYVNWALKFATSFRGKLLRSRFTSERMFFIPPIGGTQDAKIAKDSFFGFVQILEERLRIWAEPSPDGRLMNQKETIKT